MKNQKKEKKVIVTVVLVVIILLCVKLIGLALLQSHGYFNQKGNSFLAQSDCSTVKNVTKYPVSVAFSVANVSNTRDEVKTLIEKYGGKISYDSYNTYSSDTNNTESGSGSSKNTMQADASLTVTFDQSQDAFLSELSQLAKKEGVKTQRNNFSFDDGTPSGYGVTSSAYENCQNLMETLSTDSLQLNILTRVLREERESSRISMLAKLVSNTKQVVDYDISNINRLFEKTNKSSVDIKVSTIGN